MNVAEKLDLAAASLEGFYSPRRRGDAENAENERGGRQDEIQASRFGRG
jgi:hypothetical protein